MTHTTFEAGAAMIILPLRFRRATVTSEELNSMRQTSFIDVFETLVSEIEHLHVYERFYERGWTETLARQVRKEVVPRMVRVVTLAWFSAIQQAGVIRGA